MLQCHEVARFLGRDPAELLRILKKPGMSSLELTNDELRTLAEEAKQLTPQMVRFDFRQLLLTLTLMLLPILFGLCIRTQMGGVVSLSALFAGSVVLLLAQVPRLIRLRIPKNLEKRDGLVVGSVIEELVDNDESRSYRTQVTILYTSGLRTFLGVQDGFGTTTPMGGYYALRSVAEKARARALPGAVLPVYLLPADPSVFTLELNKKGSTLLLALSVMLSTLAVVLLVFE